MYFRPAGSMPAPPSAILMRASVSGTRLMHTMMFNVARSWGKPRKRAPIYGARRALSISIRRPRSRRPERERTAPGLQPQQQRDVRLVVERRAVRQLVREVEPDAAQRDAQPEDLAGAGRAGTGGAEAAAQGEQVE